MSTGKFSFRPYHFVPLGGITVYELSRRNRYGWIYYHKYTEEGKSLMIERLIRQARPYNDRYFFIDLPHVDGSGVYWVGISFPVDHADDAREKLRKLFDDESIGFQCGGF